MFTYRVNRKSPIPAYYQIALDLRQRISGGEWRAGNQLPPEPTLAEQYNVSRMTLRQAMADLVKDGILVRRRGSGTFVSQGYIHLEQALPENQPKPGMDKGTLRQQVWAELRKVAKPDSRFHWNFEDFVPDFAGSAGCAHSIRNLSWYQESRVLFIAPDNSLADLRQRALEDQKQVIVATYGLARGFLHLVLDDIPPGCSRFAASLDGLEHFGHSITFDGIKSLGGIDLLVTGVSLVTEKGVRWGKGHGYFDLEWGMFREIGAVKVDTPVIAVGHDCQVVSHDLEPSMVDTIADTIVTPTRVIQVEKIYPKPSGVLWDFVSPELRQRIPPLQSLYSQKDQ